MSDPSPDAAQMAVKYAAVGGLIGVVTGAAGLLAQMIFLAIGGHGDPAIVAASGGLMGTSITVLGGLATVVYTREGKRR